MRIRRRGRPLGFKLSDASKKAISDSKIGQKHKQETKDKISRTLILYFRRQHPVSKEIIDKYCRVTDDSLCKWLNSTSDAIDECDDVKTERAMSNIRKIEIDYGQNIELFSHELTPEFILELKEYCILNNIIVGKLF